MCVALAALDAIVHLEGAGRRAHAAVRSTSTGCRRPPDRETELRPGELITAVELPPLPIARALDLPQGARPGELRLRAGLGRGRARGRDGRHGRATCGSRSAASRTSRGAPAAAEAALRGGPRHAAKRSAPPPRPSSPTPRPLRDNGFKIELAKRTIVAVLGELAGAPHEQRRTHAGIMRTVLRHVPDGWCRAASPTR